MKGGEGQKPGDLGHTNTKSENSYKHVKQTPNCVSEDILVESESILWVIVTRGERNLH